jgi:hypothetical protein
MDIILDKLHSSLIKSTIKDVLGDIMPKYSSKLVTPIIIGGMNVLRCTNMTATARSLMNHLRINDIDIKFIIHQHLPESSDKLLLEVDRIRRNFLFDVVTHPKLQSILNSMMLESNLTIKLNQNTVFADNIFNIKDPAYYENVYNAKLINIQVSYTDNITNITKKLAFIDTTIYHNQIEDTQKYAKVFVKAKYDALTKQGITIPMYTVNGVNFATCAWNYVDTVRMLDEYLNHLSEAVTIRNITFLMKYFAKFIVMYVYINKLSDKSPKSRELKHIFEQSRKVVQQFANELVENGEKNEVDMKYVRLADFFKERLTKKTNLGQLLKAITSTKSIEHNNVDKVKKLKNTK